MLPERVRKYVLELENMSSQSVSCPHSLVATASRVTHPRAKEVEVCVIKTSLQIGLLPHFHTFHHFLRQFWFGYHSCGSS